MALILNIDTALETASVCFARDGNSLRLEKNDNQKDHAAWIHEAIFNLIRKEGIEIKNLEAVAVTIGPGSYTGLRVGLATAKGICFARGIPLITIGTLFYMSEVWKKDTDLACPMIDARRMEVFTAVYDKYKSEILEPTSLIVEGESFKDLLSSNSICFFGSGMKKFASICQNNNAVFRELAPDVTLLAPLSEKMFSNGEFAELAYSEPVYLKEFYTRHA